MSHTADVEAQLDTFAALPPADATFSAFKQLWCGFACRVCARRAALSARHAQVKEQLQPHPRCAPVKHRAGNIHAGAVCRGAGITHARP